MKKINFIKSVILLFAVFTFSNCEENGDVQFIIIDDFPASVNLTGLVAQSSFTTNGSADISDLIEGASSYIEADVESVTIELDDNYSGTSIVGTITVSAGSFTLLNQSLTLTKDPIVVDIPANASNILSVITSGTMPVTVTGNATTLLGDDDFNINLSFKIKAKVE